MEHVMSAITKISKRRAAWIFTSIFIVLVVLYLAYFLPLSRLIAPIEDQLEAIRVEDNVTAYSYTSPAFQKATSMDAFVRFINEYSSLRNNESITINQREIKHGVGKVKATLISRGGVETPVSYQLVKDNDRWKIESIILTPTASEELPVSSPESATTTETKTETPAPAETTATADDHSANTYQDPNNAYTMIYPQEWQFIKTDGNKVIFNGKPGTVSSQSSFTIQPLDMNDGSDQSVQAISDMSEASLKERSGSFKVVEDGLLPPRSNKNERWHGKYSVFSYTIDNQPMKQLQVIYFMSPKRAKYVIDFVAPEAQFETDLPAAKAMIASFTIS